VTAKLPLPSYASPGTAVGGLTPKFKIVRAKGAQTLTAPLADLVSWGTAAYCGPESIQLCASSACTSMTTGTDSKYKLADNPTNAVTVSNSNVLSPSLTYTLRPVLIRLFILRLQLPLPIKFSPVF